MDDNAGKSPGEGENPENKAAAAPQSAAGATPSQSKANDANLPIVWSPKLAAGDSIGDDLLGAGADDSRSIGGRRARRTIRAERQADERRSTVALLALRHDGGIARGGGSARLVGRVSLVLRCRPSFAGRHAQRDDGP